MPARHLHLVPADALDAVLAQIRSEHDVPDAFPPAVVAEAEAAVAASGDALAIDGRRGGRVDRRNLPLVTIDPPTSRDLDQAFTATRRSGGGYRVHYAIADVAAFVVPGGACDREATTRGVTRYQPDRRTPLYPEAIGEGGASLLPDGDRPALLWTIDLDADAMPRGEPVLERAVVRSRAKLSYGGVQADLDAGTADDALVLLREVGRRREEREVERGGVSLPLPAQVVELDGDAATLRFESSLPVEGWNAQISLLTGIVAATMMIDAGVGILRTLPLPDPESLEALRHAAAALDHPWSATVTYPDFVRSLDPAVPTDAALLNLAARTLRGAGYAAFDTAAGVSVPADPRHAAVASAYAHVTAPLRRLADRYANEILVAIASDRDAPEWARTALPALPTTMAAADRSQRSLERATVDAMEALVLAEHVGETFVGTVVAIDERGRSSIQLTEPAVLGRLEVGADAAEAPPAEASAEPRPSPAADAPPSPPRLGAQLTVRLVEADVAARRVRFVPA